MRDLVAFLSAGEHPLTVSRATSATELRESIERKFVLLRFTDTQGGTELGIAVDASLSSLGQGDFERGTGTIELVGTLQLNYQPVQAHARIDLSTLHGMGSLRAA